MRECSWEWMLATSCAALANDLMLGFFYININLRAREIEETADVRAQRLTCVCPVDGSFASRQHTVP